MTATIIPFPQPSMTATTGARNCCPRHQVEDLLVRVQETAREHDHELLVPGEVLAALAADVIGTVSASLDGRTTTRTTR